MCPFICPVKGDLHAVNLTALERIINSSPHLSDIVQIKVTPFPTHIIDRRTYYFYARSFNDNKMQKFFDSYT